MKKVSKILLLVGAGWLAACSDSTGVSTAPAGRMSVQGGGSEASLTTSDTLRFSFTIDPSRSTYYNLGAGNSIVFPAGSLCDLSSTYGADQWDQPCAVATQPVLVNAKAWLDRHGNPRIDFDKHLRFVPSASPNQWVMLTFTAYAAAWGLNSSILYCPVTTSGHCVDESKTDPTLVTVKDPVTGQMRRRLKHFSGYNVFSGQPCTPSPDDPDCIDAGGGDLFNRVGPSTKVGQIESNSLLMPVKLAAVRAGYMLAWA